MSSGSIPGADQTGPTLMNRVDDGTDATRDVFAAAVHMTRMPMVVVALHEPDQPIVFCNEAFVRLTGYELDEIIGRNCRFLQGAGTDRDTVADVRQAVNGRREYTGELLNYRKDGSPFWNALFLAPVYNPDGDPVYYFGSQLDVTRRREAEEALRQAQKMEAVGQLTGGIAHDFNNLMTIVVGQIETALARTPDDRARLALDRALKATERGAWLTQQLLAFARKQRLQGRSANLNALVTSLTEMLQHTLGRAIEIRMELAVDLPSCLLDPVQAETALLNILINARDAMPGGGRITIRTALREVTADDAGPLTGLQPGPHVGVSVTDTGVGMPAAVLGRATEPFFTTKEVGRGSGMGLAMVYGFARQSRGTMTIDSTPGEGTTVTLLFPAAEGPEPEEDRASTAPANVHGTETVLVVEDDPDILDLAAETLRTLGYHVLPAAGAVAALDVLRGPAHLDLLFTDVVMPGGTDGTELAREARRLRPDIAVLLTSGFNDPAGETGHGAGAFEMLEKPYRHSALATKVRDVLHRRTTKS